jgi:uracil-DNA glycosylase
VCEYEKRKSKSKEKQDKNCFDFLKRTIEIINPKIIRTVGIVALEALKAIEYHQSSLKKNGGKILWEFIKESGFNEIKIISHLHYFSRFQRLPFRKKKITSAINTKA